MTLWNCRLVSFRWVLWVGPLGSLGGVLGGLTCMDDRDLWGCDMNRITSAGCLIIGDEVLNGKILDTNSFEFAKFCFGTLLLPLKKTIVCGDDHDDIVASLAVLRQNCDFIVTSGGIGSTHDDITYAAVAAAFNVPCALDTETVGRMKALRGDYLRRLSPAQLQAFYRMATLPQPTAGVAVLKLFTDDSLWVPVVGIQDQVYILPGVPQLFSKLLVGLGAAVQPRVVRQDFRRFFVLTTTGESSLAPYLSALQDSCDAKYGRQKVKLGSYPHFNWKLVTISVIGDSLVSEAVLRAVVADVVANVGGGAKEILAEQEDHITTHEPRQ